MNGGKMGPNKKSNAHINMNTNGTLGGATHGYGPITNNMLTGLSKQTNVTGGAGSQGGYAYSINFKTNSNT